MTLVNPVTGEIVTLDQVAARRLTDKIKIGVEGIWHLIEEAYTSRAWQALGYSSWDDYCTREFGTSRIGIPREEQPQRVSSLRDAGLSIRAIRSATGLAKDTIAKAIEVSQPGTPGAGAPNPAPVSVAPVSAGGGEAPADTGQPAPRPITGIDGKTYPRPEPKSPRAPRRAITDQFFDAAFDLGKAVERVSRLSQDDRFPHNKEKIATKHRNDLIRARDLVTQVIELLN